MTIQTLATLFVNEPLERHLRPAGSTPFVVWDAIDLFTNTRGVGWNWSKGLYIPRQTRPSSRAMFCLYTLVSAVVHFSLSVFFQMTVQTFSPERFSTLLGDTIFDPALPLWARSLRACTISVFVIGAMYNSMQGAYDVVTFIGVAIFQQDLAQWAMLFDSPWLSTSLHDFWGRRWHQLLRQTFIILGGWPLGFVFGHVGFVLGTFLASGLVHHIVSLKLNGEVEMWYTVYPFGMMGVGVIIESAFKRMTGKRVCGWPGWVWTTSWMLIWGSHIADAFARGGMFGSSGYFGESTPFHSVVASGVAAFEGWLYGFA